MAVEVDDAEAIRLEQKLAELRSRLQATRHRSSSREDARRSTSPSGMLANNVRRHRHGQRRGSSSRRRRRRSGSDSGSASGEPVFGDAPLHSTDASAIRRTSEQAPGRLWNGAVQEIENYLGARGGASAAGANADPSRFVTYLTAVFHGMFPPDKVGPRTTREMRTLAEALDALGSGDLPRTADLLVQRFKSVEESVKRGNWDEAGFLELISREHVGLTSQNERLAAQRGRLMEQRLVKAKGPPP